MKIGDTVRFLNEIGGGVIVGFQDKNIVLVKGDDGFEIPTLISEVVVMESKDEEGERPAKKPSANADNRFRTRQPDTYVRSFYDDEDEKTVTFKPRPMERRGADVLRLYLAFLPFDEDTEEPKLEVYLINDSNYSLGIAIIQIENAAGKVRHEGTFEPNTKQFLEEMTYKQLGEWERITIQGYAVKYNKPFRIKPAFSAKLRIDGSKFYKPGAFSETDFFDEKVRLIEVKIEGQ